MEGHAGPRVLLVDVIPCTDCLRPLEVPKTPEIRTGEQTMSCIHCQARVRFFVDDSEPS